MAKMKLGIDIGGTFTDFCLLNEQNGEIIGFKTPSTPASPTDAVRDGLKRLIEAYNIQTSSIDQFVHGGTIAVNTLIQRNGANLSLFVTEGFADILEIQRLRLPDVFDLLIVRPKSLVSREQCMEIVERIRADGNIEKPLDEKSVEQAITKVLSQKVEGIVVCFLNSYKNPTHELKTLELIESKLPSVPVSCSATIWPEIREYERSMVAVINAYVRPKTENYLSKLEHVVEEAGIMVAPYITKSNGGIMTARRAKRNGAETLLSGPASGVIGASYIGKMVGIEDTLTLDMGGTSSDIALVSGGRPHYSTEEIVGEFPMIMPAIAVSCIGAGGGSIAWIDESGVLKVGPESSGADPGPACYATGGEKPTMTDAYLICGLLNPVSFAGGRMKLDRDLAKKAIDNLAGSLDLNIYQAAQAIIEVATANMYTGINGVLSRRGLDARDFTLVPFGGAGPTQACLVAREFDIKNILVPCAPGTLSALGALCCDVKTEFIKSISTRFDEILPDQIHNYFGELKKNASQYMSEENLFDFNTTHYMSADMNYVGQAFQVEVPIEERWISKDKLGDMEEAFHQIHERIYGHKDEHAPTQIMNLRLTLVGSFEKPKLKKLPKVIDSPKPISSRTIYYDRRSWKADVYQRKDFMYGTIVDGPAIVEEDESTVVILDSYTGSVDEYGNILMTKKGGN
jgi:N-methylhydantoinase A